MEENVASEPADVHPVAYDLNGEPLKRHSFSRHARLLRVQETLLGMGLTVEPIFEPSPDPAICFISGLAVSL